MDSDQSHQNHTITSYSLAPSRTATVAGISYAYRELGPKGGVPVIFFVHLAATLDNWDPRIIDPIAEQHPRHCFRQSWRGSLHRVCSRHRRVDGR